MLWNTLKWSKAKCKSRLEENSNGIKEMAIFFFFNRLYFVSVFFFCIEHTAMAWNVKMGILRFQMCREMIVPFPLLEHFYEYYFFQSSLFEKKLIANTQKKWRESFNYINWEHPPKTEREIRKPFQKIGIKTRKRMFRFPFRSAAIIIFCQMSKDE